MAIVSMDVAGYSRLMGRDEVGTLRKLNAHRSELIDQLIETHGGRIVKTMGDGLLLAFESVVAAVECCVLVQKGMAACNGNDSGDAIHFRIGVHLGDVIVEGDDIFGDGVNIAARLQEIADPGGVVISNNAHDNVEGRIDEEFTDGGAQELKNIMRPMGTWRWSIDGEPAAIQADGYALPLPDKPSIAVLPFDNMSNDPEQEFFSDGITEDIIAALSRFHQFFVIARNSTFVYKGRPVDVGQVARELGVKYVLEGSVRRAANRVRITAQLIDAVSDHHIWAEQYDRELDDIFAVQDEITARIASALGESILTDHLRRSRAKNPANMDAYDKCLQAWALVPDADRASYAAAQMLAEEAITLDPEYAQAHAIVGLIHLITYTSQWYNNTDEALNVAYECARHAVALDDLNYLAHAVLGYCMTWQQRHDPGIASLQRAVGLNPNDAFTRGCYTNSLVFAGQPDEALVQIEIATRLKPHYLGRYPHFQGRAYSTLRRYEEAERVFAAAAEQAPRWPMAHMMLAAAKMALGDTAAARSAIAEALKISPGLNLGHIPRAYPYRDQLDIDHLIELLRQAGLPA